MWMIRYRILRGWHPVMFCMIALASCAPRASSLSGMPGVSTFGNVTQLPASASLLPWVGGIAIIGGLIALVLTRGGMGARAIVIGVLLVILNDVMQRYAVAFYVPILIGTAGVSLAYAWKTIQRAREKRKQQ
jgi:hypothetical protein